MDDATFEGMLRSGAFRDDPAAVLLEVRGYSMGRSPRTTHWAFGVWESMGDGRIRIHRVWEVGFLPEYLVKAIGGDSWREEQIMGVESTIHDFEELRPGVWKMGAIFNIDGLGPESLLLWQERLGDDDDSI